MTDHLDAVAHDPCGSCKGTGKLKGAWPDSPPRPCQNCSGAGAVTRVVGKLIPVRSLPGETLGGMRAILADGSEVPVYAIVDQPEPEPEPEPENVYFTVRWHGPPSAEQLRDGVMWRRPGRQAGDGWIYLVTAQDVAWDPTEQWYPLPPTPTVEAPRPDEPDLLMAAWGIIANAHGGNWDEATEEWREAAVRWRDRFHATLGTPDPETSDG